MSKAWYTEDQRLEFREQFRARRKRQLMVAVPSILVAVAFAFLPRGASIAGVSPDVIGAAVVAFVLGALIFSARNWRCPACNVYLGSSISQRFCRKCGVQLDS